MKRVRLYELAKELRLESRQVVVDARRLGAMVNSPSSSVDEKTADRIRELYYPKKPAATEHRAARLVKTHKPAATPVETPKAPAAERKPEDQAVQKPAHSAPEAAAEPQAGAAGRTRIIKLTPKPAPMRPAPSTRPPAQPSTQAPRSTSHVAPPAEVAAPTTETPARSRRTTYIPPRSARPVGRHGKGAHKKAERFNDGPQARAFTAERSAPPAPRAARAVPAVLRPVRLMEGATVREFAERLDIKPKDVVASLLQHGVMATINQPLEARVALDVGRRFGYEVSFGSFEDLTVESEFEVAPEMMEDTESRAPVVTVMGHVDHGKTSLLDAIRESRVAEGEAGGITQRIGAYSVEARNPDNPSETRRVVFLDTPGHEAFTMMRARGARVTDVVVLVVAADDGVMPQTVEAIDHAKAAEVPILVAINKIDKPNANPERVKKELADLGLTPEAWGGTTVMVEVSAKKKENLDLLLEMILLVTEMSELKANPKRNASGTVLEAKLDKGRGPVATVLVQDGTLRVGDTLIAGTIVGRVRALIDDRGKPIKLAGPSTPVEVLGLAGLPQPGDVFQVADAAKARHIATFREEQAKNRALGAKGSRLTLESLQAQIAEGGMKELPIIIKADVQGSAEVLADTLAKLTDEKVKIRIIHAGVGAVNESDVLLASASNAIVIAFNVRPDRNAEDIAARERVDIRTHSVIYNVTDEMKKAMTGLLDPTFKETRIGVAEVRDIFKVPKFGTIAGCLVREGRITRAGDTQARLLRDNVVIYEGKIGSLRRFKDDASEVKSGFECGIGFEKYNDLKVGDVIEVFAMERVLTTA